MAVLHKEYINSEDMYMYSNVDIDIRKYIQNNTIEKYNKILSKDGRWEVFYHLTQMRTSLLNWYEFKKNSTVLEIGGGFGALTGLLCDRCAHVTTIERQLFRAEAICERYKNIENLDVYVGNETDIKLKEKFDYIILVGILEYRGNGLPDRDEYVEYLKKVSKLLKPKGKILLAVENRYGIRYFCGVAQPHILQPFEGINKFPMGTNKYFFSRQEIKGILEMSGLIHNKFYYPLPDYKIPQLIYSENYLPESNIRERVIPYYLNHHTILALENDLYDDLIENNVFEFFSNSFLIECGFNDRFCSVDYAAVTTDRGNNNAFATTIHSKSIVKKTPLYKEGNVRAKEIIRNMDDLKDHNINIVPYIMNDKSLIMPYFNETTLSDYLGKIIIHDKEKFIEIIDRFYETILRSSEHVSREVNFFQQQESYDFGIILKNAYIDMVPVNCFYTDEKFVFFDQEFVKKNYPAKYILFRTLKYTYLSITSADKIVSLKWLKQKYGLEDIWSIFEEEERKFIEENRNYNTYKYFLEWASVDRIKVHQNAEYLQRCRRKEDLR